MKTIEIMHDKKSQFVDFQFPSEKQFQIWLNKTKDKVIHLRDLGQDMQTVYIHESGEILHCDFHSRIYITERKTHPSFLRGWDVSD